MKLDIKFQESSHSFTPKFGEVHNVSDGGYERGYTEGYEKGYGQCESNVVGIIERNIADFSNDKITSIGANAFRGCTNLNNINAPNAKDVWSNSFSDCTKLTTAYLPSVTRVWQYAFLNCFALVDIVLTNATIIYSRAFDSCRGIVRLDLPSIETIESYALTGARALETLIIRADTVCTLKSADALNSTPIASGTGFVYVPDALVDSYKAATNWSTYADQIKPISELEVAS